MHTEHELQMRRHHRNDFKAIVAASGVAYISGQVVGSLITIDNSAGVHGPNMEPPLSSILQGIAVLDLANQSSALDLFFFNTKPTATYTDNTTFAPSAADLANCMGVVHIAGTDYAAAGASASVAAGSNQSNLGHVMKPGEPKGTAVYCVVVSRGTPTYTANALQVRFLFSHGL